MSQEALVVDYNHTTVYFEDAGNAVGATTSTTVRAGLGVPGANDGYVKKFGAPYPISNTLVGTIIPVPRSDGGGVNQWSYELRSVATDALLGTLTDSFGASAYVDGAVLASPEQLYIKLVVTAGTATPNGGDTLTIFTDIDPAGLAVRAPGESAAATINPWVYVAGGGATFYDADLKHGGYRHTPVNGSAQFHYWSVQAAITNVFAGAGTIVEVLDSESYENNSSSEGLQPITKASVFVQASLGQAPTLTRGVGARTTKEISIPLGFYHNGTAIYFNENGTPGGIGTWQDPMDDPNSACTAAAAAAKSAVYGGGGATTSYIFDTSVVGSVVQAGNFILDTEYGYVPTLYDPTGTGVQQTVAGAAVYGFKIIGAGRNQGVWGNAVDTFVRDCTIIGFEHGVHVTGNNDIAAQRCEIYNCTHGVYSQANANVTYTVRFNNIHDCQTGVRLETTGGGVTFNLSSFTGNVIWSCSSACFALDGSNAIADVTGTWEHNTFYGTGSYGFYSLWGWMGLDIDSTIFEGFTNHGVFIGEAPIIPGDWNCFFNNATNWNGFFNPTNNSTNDPTLNDPANNLFGISSRSSCYHTGLASSDRGAVRRIVALSANGIELNGLILDGHGVWFSGVEQTGALDTGTLKWCTVKDCAGIAVDPFTSGSSVMTVANVLVYNANTGFAFPQFANTIDESIVHSCTRDAVWCNEDNQGFNHVVFAKSGWGLYANGTGISVRNCITYGNANYGIFSTRFMYILHSCINDGVNSNVDITDASNIQSNPFFVDIDAGEEDFHIRTIEGGYPFDSRCKNAADDDYDMGAYLLTRGVTDETWGSYQFRSKSFDVREGYAPKSSTSFEDARGSSRSAAKSHRRRFQLRWNASSFMSKPTEENVDRKMIEYVSSLIETDENQKTSEQTTVRLHFRAAEYMLPGDEDNPGSTYPGVVDADDVYIYRSGSNWRPNEWKGYHVTNKWASYANGVLTAAARTLASAAAGWTVDRWAGYWVRQGIYYYRIFSNTADTLTLSDPYGRLTDEASGFSFSIQSSHKILRNDASYLYLYDELGQLIDGTYEFFIDFIVCRVSARELSIQRRLSRFDKRFNEVPNRVDFEEAGTCP